MAIRTLRYAIDCDVCGTRFDQQGVNRLMLRDDAESVGWKFCRRKDGRIAIRGGKDYCPFCAAKTWGND